MKYEYNGVVLLFCQNMYWEDALRKLFTCLLVLASFFFITGCYPRLQQVQREIKSPEGRYGLSEPHYTVVEEKYTFSRQEGEDGIFIPVFLNNEHQLAWKTTFTPSPDQKVKDNDKTMGYWEYPEDSRSKTIQVTGKGYLLNKNTFYPQEAQNTGQAFHSFIQERAIDWEQLRREVVLTGDDFDALKFGFVTLMSEKRNVPVEEGYAYLTRIAREHEINYKFPSGFVIRDGELIPRVWFAFQGPRQEWWYIDLESARRQDSYYYFGNITARHLVREYFSEYQENYRGVASAAGLYDYDINLRRYRLVPETP